MDELIEHESWWKRNWKWFVPVFGILLLFVVAIGASPMGIRISDIAKIYADPYLMDNALMKAHENKEVIGLLGTLEPINGMDIMQGIVNYSNNDTTIEIYVQIKGSKGSGRMRVFADWNKNKWKYNNISIISKKLKDPIVVLENEE